ncbi:hypothetical protein Ancab_028253 [Ancistrocladus abbreviatus]
MEQKPWLWRKKVSEKTIVAKEKVNLPWESNVEENVKNQEEELGSGRCSSNISASLALVGCNYNAKDELVEKYAKMAEEAVAGQEKAEAEAAHWRQELDKALQQGVTAEERLACLDAALKDCMQQIDSLGEDLDERIHDAVKKASFDSEKEKKKIEGKLTEANKRLANLTAENIHLTNALLCKEKLIEDLDKRKYEVEAEFETLMARLDSAEKENTFLKYECYVLEKELEIQNEERESSRRSAGALQKQYLDSVKEITRLEAECQQLHTLVRKKLQGSAASLKMKSEVNMQGRDKTSTRRRSNPTSGGLVSRDAHLGNPPEVSGKKIGFLVERLYDIDEENRTLKEILTQRDNELHSSMLKCARTVSRLAQVEAQLKELSEGEKSMQLVSHPSPNNHPKMSGFNNDVIDHPGSSASALLLELEHFRGCSKKDTAECKAIEVSEMSLMNDFVEMEKLAMVTTDTLGEASGHHGYWLQDILKMMLEEHRASNRSFGELLDDIKLALAVTNNLGTNQTDATYNLKHMEESCPEISGYLTWTSPNLCPNSTISEEAARSIQRIIELVQGIIPASVSANMEMENDECSLETRGSDLSPDYSVHVFCWRSSELRRVLQKLVLACNHVLDGKNDLKEFTSELTSALEWTFDNCVILQDDTSVREKIKKQSKSESEIDFTFANYQNVLAQMIRIQSILQEENMGLKSKLKALEFAIQDREMRLQSAIKENEALVYQLRESRQSVGSLQTELDTLKESKVMIEDQIENQKLINEDLDTQLTVAKVKLNGILQKLSSLEIELEDRNICCEELESTCLELQLQLETLSTRVTLSSVVDHVEKELKAGWEITATSAEFVDCQGTIQSMGKQLKALASSEEVGFSDKVFSSTTTTSTTMTNKRSPAQRCSLLDHMLAEDGSRAAIVNSPNSKEQIGIGDAEKPPVIHHGDGNALPDPLLLVNSPQAHCDIKQSEGNTSDNAVAIVPTKKSGGFGFLRKLFLRRKKGSSRKPSVHLPRNTSKQIHLPRNTSKLIHLPRNTSKLMH